MVPRPAERECDVMPAVHDASLWSLTMNTSDQLPAELPFRSAQRVLHEHGDGHWSDPARHRGDERCPVAGRGKLDVSHQTSVGNPIDADIHDDTLRPNPVSADHFPTPDGGHQHVGATDF